MNPLETREKIPIKERDYEGTPDQQIKLYEARLYVAQTQVPRFIFTYYEDPKDYALRFVRENRSFQYNGGNIGELLNMVPSRDSVAEVITRELEDFDLPHAFEDERDINRILGISPFSRPNLTCRFIDRYFRVEFERDALNSYNSFYPSTEERIRKFVFYLDLATGINHVVKSITQPDSVLDQLSLIQDPTGFNVVDQIVREIEEEAKQLDIVKPSGKIDSFQVPEFVVAGARFARDCYQVIYPLTDKPLPPTQTSRGVLL